MGWWRIPIAIYGAESHPNTVNISGGKVNVAAGDLATINGSNNDITPLGSSTLNTNGLNDNFIFHPGFGNDVIGGFDSTDSLQFDKAIFADWGRLLAASSQSGADTLIRFDANNSVRLTNFAVTDLTQSQAQFV